MEMESFYRLLRDGTFSRAFRNVLAAAAFFIPGSLEFRDIIAEGCYSLSQLAGILTQSSSPKSSIGRHSRSSLHLFLSGLSSIEVFLETAIQHFFSQKSTLLLVFAIEFMKSVCRLRLLLQIGVPSILLDWQPALVSSAGGTRRSGIGSFSTSSGLAGRQVYIDLTHYQNWYQTRCVQFFAYHQRVGHPRVVAHSLQVRSTMPQASSGHGDGLAAPSTPDRNKDKNRSDGGQPDRHRLNRNGIDDAPVSASADALNQTLFVSSLASQPATSRPPNVQPTTATARKAAAPASSSPSLVPPNQHISPFFATQGATTPYVGDRDGENEKYSDEKCEREEAKTSSATRVAFNQSIAQQQSSSQGSATLRSEKYVGIVQSTPTTRDSLLLPMTRDSLARDTDKTFSSFSGTYTGSRSGLVLRSRVFDSAVIKYDTSVAKKRLDFYLDIQIDEPASPTCNHVNTTSDTAVDAFAATAMVAKAGSVECRTNATSSLIIVLPSEGAATEQKLDGFFASPLANVVSSSQDNHLDHVGFYFEGNSQGGEGSDRIINSRESPCAGDALEAPPVGARCDGHLGESEKETGNGSASKTSPVSPEQYFRDGDFSSDKITSSPSLSSRNKRSGVTMSRPQCQQQRPLVLGNAVAASTSPFAAAALSAASSFNLTAQQALVLGETLYVLRPAVYAWAKYVVISRNTSHNDDSEFSPNDSRSGRHRHQMTAMRLASPTSMLALAISLLLEVLSIRLVETALTRTRQKVSAGLGRSSLSSSAVSPVDVIQRVRPHVFDAEVDRRKLMLYFYLIRSPLFDMATLRMLKAASKIINRVPLIGSLPNGLLSVLSYLNSFHFRSASSSPSPL